MCHQTPLSSTILQGDDGSFLFSHELVHVKNVQLQLTVLVIRW